MSKVVIDMGYKSYVMDTEQGIALLNALSNCEVYQEKYHSAEGDQPSFHTHHIYPLDTGSGITMRLLGNEAYNMYKLAGKPEK